MENPPIDPSAKSELKKTEFFSRLARRFQSAFALHEKEGHMWEKKDGERSWGNVSEHCLVEVARADVLADLLTLSPKAKENFMYAAALHDLSKKREKELTVPEGGITWDQYEKDISEWSKNKIVENGFSEEIAELSEAVGHGPLLKIEKMLENPQALTEEDLTYLAMHYVDAYTRGSEWVTPSDGVTNEIDARALKNKENKTLKNLQEDGKKVFDGRNYNDVMHDVARKIETLFSQLIKERKNVEIQPLYLPEYIDEEIKKEINSIG